MAGSSQALPWRRERATAYEISRLSLDQSQGEPANPSPEFVQRLGRKLMSTGLDTFDKTVQESNLWLKDIMDRLDTKDRHHAYSSLRAVLHALRDRIGAESAAHLGAQLPMLLRGLYYEGWDPTDKPTKERHEEAFLAHIARELPRAEESEVERGALAVLDVLSKHIDRGAAAKIAAMFPQDLRKFWPAFIQEAAKGRQQGTA